MLGCCTVLNARSRILPDWAIPFNKDTPLLRKLLCLHGQNMAKLRLEGFLFEI